MPGIDETKNSFRVRQRNPSEFIDGSFRTIEITDGVKAVIGKLKKSDVIDVSYDVSKESKKYIQPFKDVQKIEGVFQSDLNDLLDNTITNIITRIKKERKITKVTDAYSEEEIYSTIEEYKKIINSEMAKFNKDATIVGNVQVKEGALATIIGFNELFGLSTKMNTEINKQLLKFFQSSSDESINGLTSDITKSVIKQIETDFLNGEPERTIINNIKKYFKNTQINVPEKKVNGKVVRQAYTRTMTAKNRAQIVVRDLTKKTYNAFAEQQYKNAGVTQFEYLTANDDRVRPTHAAMNGQVFNLNSPMYRQAKNLLNEIGCRCVMIPKV